MALAPDVVELVNILQLLDAAEAEANRALEVLRQAEASGIGDLPVLEARQQFANGRAEGLAQAVGILTDQQPMLVRLSALRRLNQLGSRTLSAGGASPEKPEPATFVDAGSGSRRRDNGAEHARPAGDARARVSFREWLR